MKKILFVLTMLLSINVFSKTKQLQFNHDVFHCGEVNKFIFELEKTAGVYHVNTNGFNIEDSNFESALNTLINELGAVSPLRAEFLKKLANPTNPRVQYKKKIKIIRTSPASNIILPEGCNVEPMSNVTFNESRDYSIVINQDIFDSLSIEGKIYFFLTLSLDLQQVFASSGWMDIEDIAVDLVQSRELLACWYNIACRPITVARFHALAKMKMYNLKFFEQDHILTSINGQDDNSVQFDPNTGLIKVIKFPIETLNPTSQDLTSFYFFRNQKFPLQRSLGSAEVKFNDKGRLNCIPLMKNIKILAVNQGDPITLLNTCWDEKDQITSAQLFHGPGADTFQYQVSVDNVRTKVLDFSHLIFYEKERLNWVSGAESSIRFNGQYLSLAGMLKLYPSGKPQCFQLNQETTLRLPDGKTLKMKLDPQWKKTDLHCFKEDGNFIRSYKTYFYEAIEIIP